MPGRCTYPGVNLRNLVIFGCRARAHGMSVRPGDKDAGCKACGLASIDGARRLAIVKMYGDETHSYN